MTFCSCIFRDIAAYATRHPFQDTCITVARCTWQTYTTEYTGYAESNPEYQTNNISSKSTCIVLCHMSKPPAMQVKPNQTPCNIQQKKEQTKSELNVKLTPLRLLPLQIQLLWINRTQRLNQPDACVCGFALRPRPELRFAL